MRPRLRKRSKFYEHGTGLGIRCASGDARYVLCFRGDLRVLTPRLDLAVLGFTLALMPLLLTAASPTPVEVIRSSVEGLRSAVQRDAEAIDRDPELVIPLIREHIIPNIDTDVFARLILGRHWQNASDTQRVTFTQALADALLRIYGVHASNYVDAKVAYLGAFPVGDKPTAVMVHTEVSTTRGPPTRVDYRMALRNGNWKAIDASVDGISIVRTYRAALNEEIQRVGMEGVVQRLSQPQP